jgi:hypothetical protein
VHNANISGAGLKGLIIFLRLAGSFMIKTPRH